MRRRATRARAQKGSILDSLLDEVGAAAGVGVGARSLADRPAISRACATSSGAFRRRVAHNVAEPSFDRPAGIPDTFEQHARLMFDLQWLAYQGDVTRVVTFMIGREFSGRTYPEIGVPDAHHPISHHQRDPLRMEKCAKINHYHVSLFSEFVEKLKATPDGDGSLLDHVAIVYGAGMSEGNGHVPENLPILIVGGANGRIAGGRHVKFAKGTPLANFHLSLLDRFGVRIDQHGNSTGPVSLD